MFPIVLVSSFVNYTRILQPPTLIIEGIQHIASEARHLNISCHLSFWLSSSARTQIYLDFEEYCRLSWHAIDQWLQHYRIGGIRYWSWRGFLIQG